MLASFRCTLLPVGKCVVLQVSTPSTAAVRAAIAAYTDLPPAAFQLFAKGVDERLTAIRDGSIAEDSVYALVRCRGGGKGGFRKQLEKKGREFARAKMKEKRNSAKIQPAVESKNVAKTPDGAKSTQVVKVAEPSGTRTLVKQGLAFVILSFQQKSTSA